MRSSNSAHATTSQWMRLEITIGVRVSPTPRSAPP